MEKNDRNQGFMASEAAAAPYPTGPAIIVHSTQEMPPPPYNQTTYGFQTSYPTKG